MIFRCCLLLLLGLAGTGRFSIAADLPADATVEQVLTRLHEVGRDLKTLSARVTLSETDRRDASQTVRLGRVLLQQEPVQRVLVVFTEVERDEKVRDEMIEYKLEDGWLTDRNYARKTEVRRQVTPAGQRLNLLRLGEGPFPLPIGQAPEEVKRQFAVNRLAADHVDDAPEGCVGLRLAPLAGSAFVSKFVHLDVWVDRVSGMPRRIEALDANRATLRRTDLADVKLNVEARDQDFALPDIVGKGWNRIEEPMK